MFDYGGVLCHQPAQEDVALLAGAAGAPVADLMGEYWQSRRAYDMAELDVTEYWQQVGRGLGRSYTPAEVVELSRLDSSMWLRLQDDMVALVADLAAAGMPLALLSNAPDDVAGAISGLPLAGQFRYLIFSCQLKTAKPDPACYRGALDRVGARAQDVIFIDDRAENVAGAAALGIRSVQFTAPAQAREAVTALLGGQAGADGRG
jgi:putative hydrolase of the HAD superfamily